MEMPDGIDVWLATVRDRLGPVAQVVDDHLSALTTAQVVIGIAAALGALLILRTVLGRKRDYDSVQPMTAAGQMNKAYHINVLSESKLASILYALGAGVGFYFIIVTALEVTHRVVAQESALDAASMVKAAFGYMLVHFCWSVRRWRWKYFRQLAEEQHADRVFRALDSITDEYRKDVTAMAVAADFSSRKAKVFNEIGLAFPDPRLVKSDDKQHAATPQTEGAQKDSSAQDRAKQRWYGTK